MQMVKLSAVDWLCKEGNFIVILLFITYDKLYKMCNNTELSTSITQTVTK